MSNPPVTIESLLKAHHPFLVRLATSLVGDSHSADDLVQEVTRRALVAAPDAAAMEQPRSWLARILRNEAAREGSRRKTGTSLADSAPQAARGLVDPEALALRAEREQVVGEELYRLSPPDRDVLFLRFYDDRSVDEIAQALGLSRTAAQSRLTRAKARLAERLEVRLGAGDEESGGWQRALLPIVTGAAGAGGREAAAVTSASMSGPAWLRSGWPWIAAAAATLTALFVGFWIQTGGPKDQVTALAPSAAVELTNEFSAPVAVLQPPSTAPTPLAPVLAPQPAAAQEETRSLVATATDETSAGLLGIPVTLAPFDPTTYAIGQELRGATDRSGRFEREGLDAVPYLFRFTSREFRSYDLKDGDALEPVISRSMTVRDTAYPVRFRLAPDVAVPPDTPCTLWTIGSTVGAELPIVCETFEASAGLVGSVLDGRQFRLTAPGFAPSETLRIEPGMPRDDEGVRELIFRLESCAGAAISGQVVGRESGSAEPQPLAGADVIIKAVDDPGGRWSAPHALRTDEDGRFLSPFALPFGEFRVEVHAQGHGVHRGILQHGQNGEPITFQLEAHRVLRGQVQKDGEPVENAKVQASLSGETFPTSWGGLDGALGPRPYAWSRADGRFEIHGLPAERVALFAEGPITGGGDNATQALEVPASGDLAENIALSIGSTTLAQGRVLGPDGTPLEDIRVEAHRSGTFTPAGWAMTDESGVFTMLARATDQAVPPGDALRLTAVLETTLQPSYDRFTHDLQSIEISAGALDADFALDGLPSVTAAAKGRVVIPPSLSDSLTLEELELHFQSTSMYTGILSRSFDAATGAFEFAPIPSGTYDLSICRAKTLGVLWARSGVALEAGVELDFGDILLGDLAGAGHLEVLVHDEAGVRLDEAALGPSAVRVRMSDRMLSALLQDGGDRWRPELALTAGSWFVELRSKFYRAPKANFVIQEGETTQLVVTATRR